MSGFSVIVRDESDMSTKTQMLDYLCELMDDAQDFGWSAAKGVHAVLLCCMEENKVAWHQTEKVDCIRRSHAQKVVNTNQNGSSKKPNTENQGNPCKLFQNGSCPHINDHIRGGQQYKHMCAICFGFGKRFPHQASECRSIKKSQNFSKNAVGTA